MAPEIKDGHSNKMNNISSIGIIVYQMLIRIYSFIRLNQFLKLLNHIK